jgi:hypothetical protein
MNDSESSGISDISDMSETSDMSEGTAEDLSQLPTADLVRRAVDHAHEEPRLLSDAYWHHVQALHARSSRDTLDAALALCASADAISHAVGADVLGQLGISEEVAEGPFADESEAPLVALLGDAEPLAVASALYALGHLDRGDTARIAALADHPSSDVREAVAAALDHRSDPIAIAALIKLSSDVDDDTRDWATFALGTLSEEDSPQIRDALAARLDDPDDEVRGEALVGLATRQDERAIAAILLEFQKEDVMGLAIEAAEEFPRAEFVPHLEALLEANPGEETIELALDRCRQQ